MDGNGKLVETENVIFVRKLWNSYRILMDKHNSYVFLKRNTEIRLRMNENERWKPDITLMHVFLLPSSIIWYWPQPGSDVGR